MNRPRTFDILAFGMMVVPFIVSLLVWAELPSMMAIHWSGTSPDTYVSKPFATIGIFAFGIATVLFVRIAPDTLTNTPGGTNLTVLFLGVVFALVQTMIIAWNLGARFDVRLAMAPILVLAGVLVVVSVRR